MNEASDSGSAALVADAPETVSEAPVEETQPTSSAESGSPSPTTDAATPTEGEAADAQPVTEAIPEAPDLSTYPSFNYRADGQDHEFAGAYQDSEGNVFFTPEAVQRLKHQLAYAHAYPRRDADAQRSIAHVSKQKESAEAALSHVLQTFDKMFEDGTWQSWAENQSQNWPILREQTLRKGLELKAKADADELAKIRSEQADVEARPQQLSRVEEAVRHWGKQGGLSETEQARLIKKWQGKLDTVFPRAAKDDPITGTKAGTRTEDLEGIREDILFAHELLKGRTPAQAKAEITKENAVRTGQTAVKPPPVASVGKGTRVADKKPKTYKSTREADSDIWN